MIDQNARCSKCGCMINDPFHWGKVIHDTEACRGIVQSEARAGVSCSELVGVAGGACDRNVESVRVKLHQRAARGLSKYGVTTERTDLDIVQWLRHAQEEALDLAVYLERLIADHEAALAASPPTTEVSDLPK